MKITIDEDSLTLEEHGHMPVVYYEPKFQIKAIYDCLIACKHQLQTNRYLGPEGEERLRLINSMLRKP